MSLFQGAGVAIVTPFHPDGTVNYPKLKELINFQIDNGIDAIIICGTTGEASTLTDEEQLECIRFTAEVVNKRVPVVAGAGSNHTEHAIYLAKGSEKAGADAVLVVTPYYNKTTQKGLVAHYKAIAENISIPIILYNVPSRTGLTISPKTCYELSKIKNIIGVKDATGNISAVAEVAALCGPDFDIYSGNDDQILPILSLGGKGVISVLANVAPKQTHDMVMSYLNGDTKTATNLQLDALSLIQSLFIEVNPIPVKAALEMMGFDCGLCKMPLVPIEPEHREILRREMMAYGLI